MSNSKDNPPSIQDQINTLEFAKPKIHTYIIPWDPELVTRMIVENLVYIDVYQKFVREQTEEDRLNRVMIINDICNDPKRLESIYPIGKTKNALETREKYMYFLKQAKKVEKWIKDPDHETSYTVTPKPEYTFDRSINNQITLKIIDSKRISYSSNYNNLANQKSMPLL